MFIKKKDLYGIREGTYVTALTNAKSLGTSMVMMNRQAVLHIAASDFDKFSKDARSQWRSITDHSQVMSCRPKYKLEK